MSKLAEVFTVHTETSRNISVADFPADLEVALNYGQSTGSPQLLRFVTEHTEV